MAASAIMKRFATAGSRSTTPTAVRTISASSIYSDDLIHSYWAPLRSFSKASTTFEDWSAKVSVDSMLLLSSPTARTPGQTNIFSERFIVLVGCSLVSLVLLTVYLFSNSEICRSPSNIPSCIEKYLPISLSVSESFAHCKNANWLSSIYSRFDLRGGLHTTTSPRPAFPLSFGTSFNKKRRSAVSR